MRRRASANPSSQPEHLLHPTLQAALESLDVQLDEELTRYRRMRGRNSGRLEPQRHDRQPDMIAIGAVGGSAIAASSGLAQPEPQPSLSAMAIDPAVSDPFAEYVPPADLASFSVETGQPLTEHYSNGLGTSGLDTNHLEPDDYLASSEELLKSIAEEEDLRAEQEPGMLESLLTPLGIGSILLLLLSSVTFGYLIMNPSSVSILGIDKLFGDRAAAPAQSDNSASTTATAPDAVLPSPNLADQEFVDLNLDSLSTLPTGQSAGQSVPNGVVTNPTNASTASTVSPGVDPQAAPGAPQAPASTTNLDQLPRVATASSTAPSRQRPPAAQPRRAATTTRSAQTAARAAVPARTTAPARAATRPAARPPAPARATTPPASSPAPAPSVAVAPVTSPSQGNLYHVVTEYNGDRSLEQVRQVAGDAFLRNTNEGARVQAGAFSEQSRAEELVQDLQQQGIPARIEQP